jgi:hypothetical protein
MISLTGALQTCKVQTGYANKTQSDRFLNANLNVCPAFNGTDDYGRYVCPDSYYAKSAGCASALDRVDVENFLRPQYAEYVTLDAAGIQGSDYMTTFGAALQRKALDDINMVGGRVGLQNQANVKISCPYNAYNDAQAQLNRLQRGMDMGKATYLASQNQMNSGMY